MRKLEIFRGPNTLARRFRDVGYLGEQDALELVESVRSSVVDVVFLDPPFNLQKGYRIDVPGNLEEMEEAEYTDYLNRLLIQCVRVLRPGGSLFMYHLPEWAIRFAPTLSSMLQFRHWIAVSMKNGFARGPRLYPAHYSLLYYTKGEPSSFHRPRMAPSVCRHCGGLIKDYGGYRSIIDEKGVNLSDIWDDFSPVRHAVNKHRIANELPVTLTDRVLDISGRGGGLLLDPFVGAGTALMSSVSHDMRFVAGDLSSAAIETSKKRLDQAISAIGKGSETRSVSND